MELLKLVPWAEIFKYLAGSAVAAEIGRRILIRVKSRSARMFAKTSKVYRLINNCVKQTRIDMIARRTTIAEIHNGGVWLSNHPIYRLTLTHEDCREGVDPILDQIQEQITTGPMMRLLIDLDQNRVKYIADLNQEPEYDFLASNGSRSLWLYMLKSKKNRPMGVFAISFDHPNVLDNQGIELLMRRVHHIEELMQ